MIDFGKVPPQAIDMEEAVLGSVLLDPDAVYTVLPILKPESFYKDTNGIIYKAVLELASKGNPVDPFTVTEQLRKSGELDIVGGPVYITILSSKIVSAANVEYWARIVEQKHIQRELIRIGIEMQSRASDDTFDVSELFDYAETELLKISGAVEKKEPSLLGRVIDRVIDKIQKIINHEIKLVGLPSGFIEIDRKTGGFKEGELIIVAGRPSMGKSAIAIQIAHNAAEQGYPVALFSLEMSDESIAQRSISGASGKTNVQLIQGDCNLDDIIKQTESLINLPIYVDDTAGLNLTELRAKLRKLIMRHGIKIAVVDYLQLMHGNGETREQEVSSISRGLKKIAKDLNIPVIALSQLSRKCEERSDKRPMLSDLRESGAIEQDADVVWFVYRPVVYGVKSVYVDGSEVDSNGLMEVMLAKNRNGVIGSFFLNHNISLTEIKDLEQNKF